MTTTALPIEHAKPVDHTESVTADHGPELIVAGVAGISILTMGLLAYFGPGEYAYWLIAAAPLASIMLSTHAVLMSILRDRWEPTFYMIFTLPFLAGIALAGLLSAPTAGPAMGVFLTVTGGTLIALAAHAITRKR
jgi:hypothetical protein